MALKKLGPRPWLVNGFRIRIVVKEKPEIIHNIEASDDRTILPDMPLSLPHSGELHGAESTLASILTWGTAAASTEISVGDLALEVRLVFQASCSRQLVTCLLQHTECGC